MSWFDWSCWTDSVPSQKPEILISNQLVFQNGIKSIWWTDQNPLFQSWRWEMYWERFNIDVEQSMHNLEVWQDKSSGRNCSPGPGGYSSSLPSQYGCMWLSCATGLWPNFLTKLSPVNISWQNCTKISHINISWQNFTKISHENLEKYMTTFVLSTLQATGQLNGARVVI